MYFFGLLRPMTQGEPSTFLPNCLEEFRWGSLFPEYSSQQRHLQRIWGRYGEHGPIDHSPFCLPLSLHGPLNICLSNLSIFPGGSVVKSWPANAGGAEDKGLIPGSGRSPGGENGNPLQYSCLESPMDRAAWRAIVHNDAKNQIWLSDWACTHIKPLLFHIHMNFFSPLWSPKPLPPTSSLVFSWELDLRALVLLLSYSFSWVFPKYTCYESFFFSSVNLSHINLVLRPPEEPRRVGGNFFIPGSS